ncbi:MAG: FmdB family transcriptional regulator [Rhizobiales bacterium 32-66-8]|nr:MAG: FmdB family transcriptional regulator [Azorhizobium sp. 12-66-6]OYX13855.1 MAG: FmdB family transcriptional regulator [Rhizobiales bacterium 32-66-8]
MPVYDYMCEDCGPFTQMHPMSLCAEPQPCPICAKGAPRAFLTAPYFASMDAGRRRAIATNERSAHAPMTSSQFAAKGAGKGAAHGPGCGCCGTGLKGKTRTAPSGAKSFPSARPWMISH